MNQPRAMADGVEPALPSPLLLDERSARKPPQRPTLVQGDVIGLVALDLILRFVGARVMDIAFVVHVFGVHADDLAAHPAGFRIPADVIADLECSGHADAAPESAVHSR